MHLFLITIYIICNINIIYITLTHYVLNIRLVRTYRLTSFCLDVAWSLMRQTLDRKIILYMLS